MQPTTTKASPVPTALMAFTFGGISRPIERPSAASARQHFIGNNQLRGDGRDFSNDGFEILEGLQRSSTVAANS